MGFAYLATVTNNTIWWNRSCYDSVARRKSRASWLLFSQKLKSTLLQTLINSVSMTYDMFLMKTFCSDLLQPECNLHVENVNASYLKWYPQACLSSWIWEVCSNYSTLKNMKISERFVKIHTVYLYTKFHKQVELWTTHGSRKSTILIVKLPCVFWCIDWCIVCRFLRNFYRILFPRGVVKIVNAEKTVAWKSDAWKCGRLWGNWQKLTKIKFILELFSQGEITVVFWSFKSSKLYWYYYF